MKRYKVMNECLHQLLGANYQEANLNPKPKLTHTNSRAAP
jgi:hypothetical protein